MMAPSSQQSGMVQYKCVERLADIFMEMEEYGSPIFSFEQFVNNCLPPQKYYLVCESLGSFNNKYMY